MPRSCPAALATLMLLLPSALRAQSTEPPARQVFVAESTFAASFARRDTAAFAALVAPDAVFFGRDVLRGRAAVVEGWRPLLTSPEPPFSWRPDVVELASDGTLALSSGPVFAPDGRQTGVFNSVWRREPDGRWRVVFDKGSPVCDGARKP